MVGGRERYSKVPADRLTGSPDGLYTQDQGAVGTVRVRAAVLPNHRNAPGGSGEVAPPVPIPNTEVKRLSADDTAFARVWENRSPPGVFLLGPVPLIGIRLDRGSVVLKQTACHLTVLASDPTLAAGASAAPPNGCHPPVRVVADMLQYSQVAGCSGRPRRLGKERKQTTPRPSILGRMTGFPAFTRS